MGVIFLDIWHRSGKLPGAATFLLKAGCRGFKDGEPGTSYRVPECAISCNFEGHTELSLEELVTFYHEIGHALHVILARTEYQQLSGTRGPELDFAEIPSTLMEYFALDYRVLSTYAKDKDKKVIPEQVLRDMRGHSGHFAAHNCMTSITWSLFDQIVHGPSFQKNMGDIHAELLAKYLGIADRRAHTYTNFMHLAHYGSGYHCYLLSKVYAAHIWHTRFAKDPLSAEVGSEWRDKVLKHGGARDAKEMMTDFLQVAEPNIDYLIQDVQAAELDNPNTRNSPR